MRKKATEVAWAAGFFDGEGTTRVEERGTTALLRLAICNTERSVMDRFVALVGVGRVLGPYGPYHGKAHKPIFQWRTSGSAARDVLALLYPYLSAPKRAQADAALAAERTAAACN